MLIHQEKSLTIYFGDHSDQLVMTPESYDLMSKIPSLLDIGPFCKLQHSIGINNLMFARQVHGTQIHEVTKQMLSSMRSFSFEGDALVTKEPYVGIGVLTADCLPIIIYDHAAHAVAIIHAGWRSSVQQIAAKTIQFMNKLYNTNPSNLRIFFGPSAGPCCYNVGTQLIDELGAYRTQTINYRGGKPYFDNRLYNQLMLQAEGVPSSDFCSDYALCTICNHQWWSYRRQGEQAGRQMTVATMSSLHQSR